MICAKMHFLFAVFYAYLLLHMYWPTDTNDNSNSFIVSSKFLFGIENINNEKNITKCVNVRTLSQTYFRRIYTLTFGEVGRDVLRTRARTLKFSYVSAAYSRVRPLWSLLFPKKRTKKQTFFHTNFLFIYSNCL